VACALCGVRRTARPPLIFSACRTSPIFCSNTCSSMLKLFGGDAPFVTANFRLSTSTVIDKRESKIEKSVGGRIYSDRNTPTGSAQAGAEETESAQAGTED
jgi:hypothetical protein